MAFGFKKGGGSGPGYVILNIIRVLNIIVLLAVTIASFVMLVKTFVVSKFYFFDGASHLVSATLAIFLITSETGLFRQYWMRNWPLLSLTHGFVTLGILMVILGVNVLGNLNKEATSRKSLGDPCWRIVISAGILVTIIGAFNIIASYIFRQHSLGVTARMVRAYGAVAPQKVADCAAAASHSVAAGLSPSPSVVSRQMSYNYAHNTTPATHSHNSHHSHHRSPSAHSIQQTPIEHHIAPPPQPPYPSHDDNLSDVTRMPRPEGYVSPLSGPVSSADNSSVSGLTIGGASSVYPATQRSHSRRSNFTSITNWRSFSQPLNHSRLRPGNNGGAAHDSPPSYTSRRSRTFNERDFAGPSRNDSDAANRLGLTISGPYDSNPGQFSRFKDGNVISRPESALHPIHQNNRF